MIFECEFQRLADKHLPHLQDMYNSEDMGKRTAALEFLKEMVSYFSPRSDRPLPTIVVFGSMVKQVKDDYLPYVRGLFDGGGRQTAIGVLIGANTLLAEKIKRHG